VGLPKKYRTAFAGNAIPVSPAAANAPRCPLAFPARSAPPAPAWPGIPRRRFSPCFPHPHSEVRL
jgi:hypothetical protein